MSTSALFSGERELRTFVFLNQGSNALLEIAKNEPRGSYYTTMAALTMRAFTFEAYLNHLGGSVMPYWDSIDSIRVMEKVAVLCGHLKLTPNMGMRPYQTLRSLFRYRNSIAHGKSEVLVRTEVEVSASVDPHTLSPTAEWEDYTTVENAQRAQEDITAIIVELHNAAGLGPHPFVHGVALGTLTLKA